MPSGLSGFEFAFTQATFQTRIQPFVGSVYASQLLVFSAGLHYAASICLFFGLLLAAAWAANHDKTSLFGVQGAIGDMMCWNCVAGCKNLGDIYR